MSHCSLLRALISVVYCITVIFAATNGLTCNWAPGCQCEHQSSVDKGFDCVYNSMYIDGHDVVTCSGQNAFPKFSNTDQHNDFTDISGSFGNVPANAMAYKQYSSSGSACVYITTTNNNGLTLDSGAFNNVEGIFVIKDVAMVTVMPNAIKAAVVRPEGPGRYGRYGVESTGLHIYSVNSINLPENFASTVIPSNTSPSSQLAFRLKIEESTVKNVDENTFGFGEVDEIEFPWLSPKYFQEAMKVFQPQNKELTISDLTVVVVKNNLKFRLDLQNAIFTNDKGPNVNLGLPKNKLKSIAFQIGYKETEPLNFGYLSEFSDTLQRVKCERCDLTEIPEEILTLKELKELNLYSNGITSLSNATLSKMSRIEKLNLSSNKIDRVDVGAFDNFRNLRSVDLSENPLGEQLKNQLAEKFGKMPNPPEFLCYGC